MKTKPLRIKIGAACNNACYFCTARFKKYHRDAEYVLHELRRGLREKRNTVVFTGLEPTIHPSILGLIAAARRAGYARIVMDTNARMFRYPQFARSAEEAGLNEARVLVPHFTREGYAAITGVPEGFEQCAAGIKNLTALESVHVVARLPVCGRNQRDLFEIVRFCHAAGIREMFLFFPKGYFSETEAFDAGEFDAQLRKAQTYAAGQGFGLDCRRVAEYHRCVSEMEEQSASCFYPTFYVGRRRHPEILEALLRPTFACNQICRFCWVNPSQEKPGTPRIESEIRHIIRKRIPKLGISGGEPTLEPQLPRYVALAKNGGVRQVELHTNAVRLTDPVLCLALRDAGLDVAYCTLLAPDAAVSDAITRTQGTFRKTVTGILNLMTHSIRAVAHCVIMADNYRLLPEFVRFVNSTFTYGDTRLPITFSFVAPRDMQAMHDGIVPRFTDVVPYLDEALAVCSDLGIPFCAGEGLKGIPPCALPFRDRYMRQLHPPPPMNLVGSAFVKKTLCSDCIYDTTCFGVRRYYAEHYGLEEIRPVSGCVSPETGHTHEPPVR